MTTPKLSESKMNRYPSQTQLPQPHHSPLGAVIVRFQEMPLHLVFGRMICSQSNVSGDEAQVDRASFQPICPPQYWLEASPAVVHLLDVLPELKVLDGGADAFPDRLVVEVAVCNAYGTHLKEGFRHEFRLLLGIIDFSTVI